MSLTVFVGNGFAWIVCAGLLAHTLEPALMLPLSILALCALFFIAGWKARGERP